MLTSPGLASDDGALLDHRQAGRGEIAGADEAVMPCPDDHHIIAVATSVLLPVRTQGQDIGIVWIRHSAGSRGVGEHLAHSSKRQAEVFGHLSGRHSCRKGSLHSLALPLL